MGRYIGRIERFITDSLIFMYPLPDFDIIVTKVIIRFRDRKFFFFFFVKCVLSGKYNAS